MTYMYHDREPGWPSRSSQPQPAPTAQAPKTRPRGEGEEGFTIHHEPHEKHSTRLTWCLRSRSGPFASGEHAPGRAFLRVTLGLQLVELRCMASSRAAPYVSVNLYWDNAD